MGYFDFLDEEEDRRKKRNVFNIGNTGPDKISSEGGGAGEGDTPKIDPSGDASSIKPDPKAKTVKSLADADREYQRAKNSVDTVMNQGVMGLTDARDRADFQILRQQVQKGYPQGSDDVMSLAQGLEELGQRKTVPEGLKVAFSTASQKLRASSMAFLAAKDQETSAQKEVGGKLFENPNAVEEDRQALADMKAGREKLIQELQNVDAQLPTASIFKKGQLEAKKVQLTKQIEGYQNNERSIEERLNPPPQNQVDPMAETPTEDIDRGIASTGSSKKEFVESINDAMGKLAAYFGPGFEPTSKVSFAHGLANAISAMGPEAQIEFSQFAKEASAREAEEKAQQQAMTAEGMQAPGGEQPWMTHFRQRQAGVNGQTGDQYDQQLGDLRGQIQENLTQQAYMRKQFAESQEMQSWTAILAYAVLSVLLGPQAAFVFFSNARQKGKLKDWLAQLEMEMQDLRDQERYTRTEAAYARREAARQMQRGREREEDKMHDFRKMWLSNQMILSRMQQSNPEGAGAYKKLKDAFGSEMTLAARAKSEMDAADRIISEPFGATEDDKKRARLQKQASEQRYLHHLNEATDIHDRIRQLGGVNDAMAPDEVDEEELEEMMRGGQ